jgi:hypothetical protein
MMDSGASNTFSPEKNVLGESAAQAAEKELAVHE